LFVQFKRADCLTRPNTRELAKELPLGVPYFRFQITARSRSAQHDMLCALDTVPGNQVFYAAPRFHEFAELDAAYLAGDVAGRSFYIRPRDIGPFTDDGPHNVVFDDASHFVCSEARPVKATRGREVLVFLRERLDADARRLADGPLDEALLHVEKIVARRVPGSPQPDPLSRADGKEHRLRRLADLSLRFFNAQLFIVQPRPVP
jgi:hypothetical protein